jgi:hypothetical protein
MCHLLSTYMYSIQLRHSSVLLLEHSQHRSSTAAATAPAGILKYFLKINYSDKPEVQNLTQRQVITYVETSVI